VVAIKGIMSHPLAKTLPIAWLELDSERVRSYLQVDRLFSLLLMNLSVVVAVG